MKWPKSITLVRHGQSAYNELKAEKQKSRIYADFVFEFERRPSSGHAEMLAATVRDRFALNVSDYETPLTDFGHSQALQTGEGLRATSSLPDVIFVSPYLRTRQTLEGMMEGWPELRGVKVIPDDRIREKEHGLSHLYNDWRVFHVFHPEQRELFKLMGPYWYQFPQGESTSNVRDRTRSITSTFIREYQGANVLVVTHHLTILSIRANYERLTPEQFLELDEKQKPRNCGVTTYLGDPNQGSDGKLVLTDYNRCFWEN
jgi:broad specificity phosphatase PhoE